MRSVATNICRPNPRGAEQVVALMRLSKRKALSVSLRKESADSNIIGLRAVPRGVGLFGTQRAPHESSYEAD